MNVEQWIKLIEALVALVQAVCWPLIVLFVLIDFRAPIKKFIDNLGVLTVNAGSSGFGITAKRQEIEAAALLGAASGHKSNLSPEETIKFSESQASEIANLVSKAVSPQASEKLAKTFILWFDRDPSNNIYEIKLLELLGIKLTISTVKEDALSLLKLNQYHVIISNIENFSDRQVISSLSDEIKRQNFNTPLIIYAESNRFNLRDEELKRDVFGITNKPQELFRLVMSAIKVGKY